MERRSALKRVLLKHPRKQRRLRTLRGLPGPAGRRRGRGKNDFIRAAGREGEASTGRLRLSRLPRLRPSPPSRHRTPPRHRGLSSEPVVHAHRALAAGPRAGWGAWAEDDGGGGSARRKRDPEWAAREGARTAGHRPLFSPTPSPGPRIRGVGPCRGAVGGWSGQRAGGARVGRRGETPRQPPNALASLLSARPARARSRANPTSPTIQRTRTAEAWMFMATMFGREEGRCLEGRNGRRKNETVNKERPDSLSSPSLHSFSFRPHTRASSGVFSAPPPSHQHGRPLLRRPHPPHLVACGRMVLGPAPLAPQHRLCGFRPRRRRVLYWKALRAQRGAPRRARAAYS